MRVVPTLASAALMAAALAPAVAHEQVYQAQLLGSSEVPAAATTGHGLATVTFDFDLATMRVQATFADLVGNVTASHIHCCTAPGSNVGVATVTPTFTGFPAGVKAGTYDRLFDMSLSSSYNAAFITAHGGTAGSAMNDLIAGLNAGKAYLNIHTQQFPGGELRALLVPVPEPQTYALLGAGLALVGWRARARRAA